MGGSREEENGNMGMEGKVRREVGWVGGLRWEGRQEDGGVDG